MDLEKLLKKLPTGFKDEADGMTESVLRAQIIQAEANIKAVENERDEDEKLTGAKELVKDLSGPYRDAISAQRAKIAYLLHRLEEEGVLGT